MQSDVSSIYSTAPSPTSNVEFVQAVERNYYLYGTSDGRLVLEELKVGGTLRFSRF